MIFRKSSALESQLATSYVPAMYCRLLSNLVIAMGILRLGSGGGLVIALVFNIVALATPAWINTPGGSIGLFKVKTTSGAAVEFEKDKAEKVAIAFNIMSDVMLLCAAVLVLMSEKDEDKKQFGMMGGVLAIVGALFIMIGMASYTGLYKPTIDIPLANSTWGYSFALGWTAFCIALIGGGVAVAG